MLLLLLNPHLNCEPWGRLGWVRVLNVVLDWTAGITCGEVYSRGVGIRGGFFTTRQSVDKRKRLLLLGQQISPFGVLFKIIFRNGIVLKIWDCFGCKMHGGIKQTVSGTGEFTVPWKNRHWEWRFGHAWGTASQTGEFQQLGIKVQGRSEAERQQWCRGNSPIVLMFCYEREDSSVVLTSCIFFKSVCYIFLIFLWKISRICSFILLID